MKIAFIYHYYSKNYLYDDNYRFFLEKVSTEKIDIYISSNKPIKYIKNNIINLVVDNVNYDYGGFSNIVIKFKEKLFTYDYIFFINNSVRGPFFNPSETKKNWYMDVINLFDNDTGIIGTLINLKKRNSEVNIEFGKKYDFPEPYTHVQSSFFVLPKIILRKLYEDNFFSLKTNMSYRDVVINYEILLSKKVISYGFNLKTTLNIFNAYDYRQLSNNFYNECIEIDFQNIYRFLGNLYNPNDFVFLKTNRRVLSHLELWIISKNSTKKMKKNIYTSNNLRGLVIYLFYDFRLIMRLTLSYLKLKYVYISRFFK